MKTEIEGVTAQWVPKTKSQAKAQIPVPVTIETRRHIKKKVACRGNFCALTLIRHCKNTKR